MNIVERYNVIPNHIRYNEPYITNINDIDWSMLIDSRISQDLNNQAEIRLEFRVPTNERNLLQSMSTYFSELNGSGVLSIPIGGVLATRRIIVRNVRFNNMHTTFDYNNYCIRLTVILTASL